MGTKKKLFGKVCKYIQKNDLPKLKNLLRKHAINPCDVKLDGNNTVLHLACDYGHDRLVRYFLSKGCSPLMTNDADEIPLHLACQYARESENPYVFVDLLEPLIKESLAYLQQGHEKASSLQALVDILRQRSNLRNKEETDSDDDNISENCDFEELWRQKIADEIELEQECGVEIPVVFLSRDERYETYDEWAARISTEYYNKQHGRKRKFAKGSDNDDRQSQKHFKSTTNTSKTVSQPLQPSIAKSTAHRKLLQLKARLKYDQACRELFSCDQDQTSVVKFDTLPWPDHLPYPFQGTTDERIAEMLFFDMEKRSQEFKKYLRAQKIQWHPDRFMHRCHNRLAESEVEKILEKVKVISQVFNSWTE